jgi:fructose-bisphosphate aldolase class II
MIDGSLLPYDENILLVKKVVDVAKKHGASVEDELGIVGGNEGEGKAHNIMCTEPETAKDFCNRGLVLEKGRKLFEGDIDEAIEFYDSKH